MPALHPFRTLLVVALLGTLLSSVGLAQTDAANGDWSAEYITLRNTPEAEFMVRVGSITNVGFGFTDGMNPVSAEHQWSHGYPWQPREGAADGTDRIMLGTSFQGDWRDGYSWVWTEEDDEAVTRPVVLEYDLEGTVVRNALLQIVIDDFQASTTVSRQQPC